MKVEDESSSLWQKFNADAKCITTLIELVTAGISEILINGIENFLKYWKDR